MHGGKPISLVLWESSSCSQSYIRKYYKTYHGADIFVLAYSVASADSLEHAVHGAKNTCRYFFILAENYSLLH